MTIKTCVTCKVDQTQSNFESKRNQCKLCRKAYLADFYKKYYTENKSVLQVKMLSYRSSNKDSVRIKQSKSNKKRKQEDLQFRIACNLRSRLSHAIKDNQKTGSAIKDLGCSIEELKSFIESKFQPGMNWNNWSLNGWHIDHIKPLSAFDLSDKDQLLKACNYTNLQPMWSNDNWAKGSKWH